MLMDISTLRAVTGDFPECNKLGEGGFGAVYKVKIVLRFLYAAKWEAELTFGPIWCTTGYSSRRRRDSGEEAVEELYARRGGAQERSLPGGEAQAQESCQACGCLPGAAGAAARLRVCPQPKPRPDPIR